MSNLWYVRRARARADAKLRCSLVALSRGHEGLAEKLMEDSERLDDQATRLERRERPAGVSLGVHIKEAMDAES